MIKRNKLPTKKVGSFVYVPKNLIDKIFDGKMKELLKPKLPYDYERRIPKRMVYLLGKQCSMQKENRFYPTKI